MTPQKKPESVLVTGAEGALGRAVARRFTASSAKVFGTYLKDRPTGADASEIRWIQMDVSDPGSVRKSLAAAGEPIEALIHCAGGFRFQKAEQWNEQDLDFLIDTNLRSAFHLSRELIPSMKERNFGRIVFISSRATLNPTAGMGPYAASKAGLNALTSSLADEVRSYDINVNAILPTTMDTPANRRDMPQADFNAWVPLESISDIIFQLTQPWGKPIHGALIPVAGRL